MPRTIDRIRRVSRPTLAAYEYAANIDRSAWAWEFLRRNPDYQRDWCTKRAGVTMPLTHRSGASVYRSRKHCRMATAWGLCNLVNPEHDALESDVFWLTSAVPNVLTARAVAVTHVSTIRCFDLSDFTCRKAILFLSGHSQQLTLRQGSIYVQIMISGAPVVFGNAGLTFEIDGVDDIATDTPMLRSLYDLRYRTTGPPTGEWSQGETRLRDALVALDGHLAGATYREIAATIYGSERVDEDWRGPSRYLKERVRRSVKRGIDLMNGGYRHLL